MKTSDQDKNKPFTIQALENLRVRLLDLSARNRLINFRHTKSSLRIIDELPNQLVKTLLADTEMRFLPVPKPTQKELIKAGYSKFDEESKEIIELRKPPTAEEWAKYLGFATNYEVPEHSPDDNSPKHTDKAIQTLLYPYEMEDKLKSLLNISESAIQEMGANILYMAFGFLEWFETNYNQKPRLAPLFLVPVRLYKGRLNERTRLYEFTLRYSGEDIIPNLSLKEKLRVDFGMALPDLDENTEPEDYFREVYKLIKDHQPNWRIRRYISLALLNFSKLLMYLDLDPARWPKDANIIEHPVVSRFLTDYNKNDDTEDDAPDYLGFGEEYNIDDIEDIHTKYPLIDDADSSQHSALIDALDGKNLIIEGPPGTGKSQTITNLIAAAIGQGKKVLFVAEKLAALEVVKRRLDAAGLGDFCLELHSHKSQKRRVIDEIDSRLKKRGKYRKPREIKSDIKRYEELKEKLRTHVERINRKWKNTGKTLYEIFTAATRYRLAIGINPERFHPEGYNGENFDTDTHRRNKDQVEAYRKVCQAVVEQLGDNKTLQQHPWFGVRNDELQIFDIESVIETLYAWQVSLENIKVQVQAISETFGCPISDVAETLTQVETLLADLKKIPPLKGNELLDQLPTLHGHTLEKIHNSLELFNKIQDLYKSLSQSVPSQILKNLSIVDQLQSGNEKLKQLVASNVRLDALSQSIKLLHTIQKQLEERKEILDEVASSLGEIGKKYLTVSRSGLAEFKTILDLVGALSPTYWKYRHEIFDNEELDELLPRLKADLENLQVLYEKIHSVFSVEDIPDKSEIRRLGGIVAAGGFFRWFNSEWRAARKKLLSYAANPQVTYTSMLPLIDDFASYAGSLKRLRENKEYKEALGPFFKDKDTDIDALIALRSWYKEVREQYGIGFGSKVSLGDAILSLNPNIVNALRSLYKQGIPGQIDKLLNQLDKLREVFPTVEKLHDPNALLIGEEGVLPQLLNEINEALENCSPLIDNDLLLTVADIDNLVNQLISLKKQIARWNKIDFNKKFFQEKINLQIGPDADNSKELSVLHDTLCLADIIANKIQTDSLVQFIYAHPHKNSFSKFSNHAQQLNDAVKQQESSYKIFADKVLLDRASWLFNTDDRIDDIITRNQLALDHQNYLQNWLDYIRERKRLEELGLGKLAVAVEKNEIGINHVDDAYNAGIFDLLAREILHDEPELARFSGHSQESLQEQFREYDNKLKQLHCEYLAWKIDKAKIPAGRQGSRVGDLTECALLKHECSKKKRHIPIRQLLQRAGNALLALKPCFMMGPMSVAQYLTPGILNFDLVIMDEASQIRPQDALGSIARGSQLVVVGDPKQLPPTSFFDRIISLEDVENPAIIEESESILDATLPIFSARRLRWHYRSQHESLIAFSNHFFYDNDLVLFPSPFKGADGYGIKYHYVEDGCFKNSRNIEEAKIIAEAVREHFRHYSDETLGVVAMNVEQRLQIETAIEALAKEDPIFRKALEKDAARHESLFVKNLENVQGDERDVIIISMTYGPREPGGKVYQRFRPINADVGWRRLNVLLTRSRKRMHIFSSMESNDIILGPGTKRGVRALHDFLSYCETGSLHTTIRETGRPPDSDFEIAVMNALKKEGFECTPQVGVAGFFIDLAVIDPGNPNRYLMGIECDGATYHSAKSTRDRDRLRQTILERLGWRIRRIWSTDWFKNPEGELAPIIRELHELKSSP